MKPAWDKLGSEFAVSSVVVGDADCTKEQSLCSKFDVTGYPTILSFKDGSREGQSYKGGRDFDSLKKFVEDELVSACAIADPSLACSEKEVKYIDSMRAKGAADIAKQLTRLTGMLGKSMKPELKAWVAARLNILRQLSEEVGGKEEL